MTFELLEKLLWAAGLALALLLGSVAVFLGVIGMSEHRAGAETDERIERKVDYVGKTLGDHLEFDHGDKMRGLK